MDALPGNKFVSPIAITVKRDQSLEIAPVPDAEH